MTTALSLPLSTVLGLILAALIGPQVVLTLWFAWIVRRRTRSFVSRNHARQESATIPAEVILCLRGCDATLEDVFAALARQSHRNWRLRVVVDAETDPAWDVAQACVTRLETTTQPAWSSAVIEPLASRPTRGSLKCASLRQALRTLAPETQVVALIDADSVVHRDWLLTMVDECMRPGIGAVSGNRWYDPDCDTPAAVVRAVWNAGAIVQMTTFGIPWGGSLAVRREALNASGWIDVIESTLCEDTALAAPLARSGWTYQFVPALTAIDRDDDISFRPLTRWIARQLLTARLHHPAWPLVAVHGVATSIALVVAAGGLLAAVITSNETLARACGGAFLAYEMANLGLLAIIATTIRSAVAVTGRESRPLGPGRAAWWAVMIPVTQCVYAVAMATAIACRSIEWRGVTYAITGKDGSVDVVTG